jgi:hypothetical protein
MFLEVAELLVLAEIGSELVWTAGSLQGKAAIAL